MEPVQQTTQVQPIPPQQPKSHSVSVPVLILCMIIVSAISSFGTYTLLSQQKTVVSSSPIPTTTQPSDPSYLKRQFSLSEKFFSSFEYPKELTEIQDSNLIGMKCTKQYLGQDGSYTLGTDPNIKLTDPNILQKIKVAANSLNTQTIDATEICETEDGRSIIEYERWAGGGGAGNISYFGLINSSGSFKQITSIPTDYSPYFTCQNPLQLTKNHILYYQCGGGDGGGGSASIFSIDLSLNTHKLVFKCTTQSSGIEGEPAKTSCN